MSGDKVSEYFSFQLVLPKLFQIFALLFGLRFVILSDTNQPVETWHPDVMPIAVWDEAEEGGGFLGYLFIDPYPREGKYGHVGQYGLQPVCLMTCVLNWNFDTSADIAAGIHPTGRDKALSYVLSDVELYATDSNQTESLDLQRGGLMFPRDGPLDPLPDEPQHTRSVPPKHTSGFSRDTKP